MAGVLFIREKNTASETPTIKTSTIIRFKNADNSIIDENFILVKPSIGNTRSYEKWIRLYLSTTSASTSVNNIRFYTSGINELGAGITLYVRTTNPSTFSTPSVPVNDSAGTNAFTYTRLSPKSLVVSNTGPFTTAATDIGDYLVLWLSITTSVVSPGNSVQRRTALEACSISWDENV